MYMCKNMSETVCKMGFFAFINGPNALAVTWSHVTSD